MNSLYLVFARQRSIQTFWQAIRQIFSCGICCLFYFASASGKDLQDSQEIRKAVVRIEVISQQPDVQTPWRMKNQSASTGTGFYIGQGRVLTNAHVVAQARFVTIQKDGDSKKEPARIRFIAHDSDLALLEVEKKDFFSGIQPLPLGEIPTLHSSVFVVGYPIGGDEISITEGIVSRLEYQSYVHSKTPHLILQVDAAINPGNSGGPVLQGNKVIGVAFESYHGANNISYAIPTPVIHRFLKDVSDGIYHGHPEDGLWIQSSILDNPNVRDFYQIPQNTEGVFLHHVAWYAPTYSYLQAGDFLLEVDGKPIGNDGLIQFEKERVDFRTLFDLKLMGETITFQIWRSGKKQWIQIPILSSKPHLKKGLTYQDNLPYLVIGGVVFIELSEEYLEIFGRNWETDAPLLLRYLYQLDLFEQKMQQKKTIVLVSQKLPHAFNQFWEVSKGQIVQSVNGVSIDSLSDLKKAFEQTNQKTMMLEFWGKENPWVMYPAKLMKANPQIAEKYGIPQDKFIPQQLPSKE